MSHFEPRAILAHYRDPPTILHSSNIHTLGSKSQHMRILTNANIPHQLPSVGRPYSRGPAWPIRLPYATPAHNRNLRPPPNLPPCSVVVTAVHKQWAIKRSTYILYSKIYSSTCHTFCGTPRPCTQKGYGDRRPSFAQWTLRLRALHIIKCEQVGQVDCTHASIVRPALRSATTTLTPPPPKSQ